jgi:glycosyltransferase involved in cell wall biosynthesis
MTSSEQGGAEAHVQRLWTDPRVASVARAHLLGSLPRWSETGLPATDIGSTDKWSARHAARSVVGIPYVRTRGLREIARVDDVERFTAYYASFKREQVLFTPALSRSAPVVWMEHGHFPVGRLRGPLLRAYRRSSRHVSAIVCVSDSVRDEIAGLLHPVAPEFAVIENTLDPRWTAPADDAQRAEARRALGIADDASPVVVAVARLIPRKRIALAIDAMRHLPTGRLIVCGDGPEGPALRARAAGSDRILFTGHLPDPRPVYAAADVSLLISWEEGFGQVLVEGALAGLPAVVAADGGFAERVSGWGAVAAEPTPEAVAEAIVAATRIPAAAPRAWAEARSPERWAAAHLALLRRVTARRA